MKYVRNNPLNIRYSEKNEWLGQIGERNGFCVFSEEKYGWRAGFVLLKNYHKKGFRTVSQIIHRFAPASENPTSSYVSFVCDKLQQLGYESYGVEFKDAALDLGNDMVVVDLLLVMSIFETGQKNQSNSIRCQLSEFIDKFKGDYVITRGVSE